MLEIILIRPGATDYDKFGRIQGTLDIPLNAQGQREVAQAIAQLRDRRLEAIYTSDSEPALQTAQALADGLGIKLKKLDNFDNLDLGLWQGMLVDEVKRKHPRVYRQWQEQPESICPPEGEMLDQARDRVQAGLARLIKKHRSGVLSLVVPEPLASVVSSLLRHREIGDLWKAAEEHGTWEAIEIEPRDLVSTR